MIWVLALHIMAVIVWCATLLYLLQLVAAVPGTEQLGAAQPAGYLRRDSLARYVFTYVSTPLALLAVVAGTALVLVNSVTDAWLIVKLTLVAVLVVGHACAGGLILRFEAGGEVHYWSYTLTAVLACLMLSIVAIVLAKPDLPWLPGPT